MLETTEKHPTSNLQAPEKHQAPNSKYFAARGQSGGWLLALLWSLEVGCWCFSIRSLRLLQPRLISRAACSAFLDLLAILKVAAHGAIPARNHLVPLLESIRDFPVQIVADAD